MYARMGKEHAERSIIIRRLTMTCWSLRNRLLPLLWADTEGCVSHTRYDYTTGTGGGGLHLYAQCIYLSNHRAIAAHVRIFSVDLSFFHAPEDLVTKLVDCLVRLPNLKTLEILSAGSRAPISKALKRKYAVFPSIRELRITPACHHFVRKCPNLDSLIFTSTMDTHAPSTIRSHGGGLKRLAGVTVYDRNVLHWVTWGCPNLREIGVVGSTKSDREQFKLFRKLKYLAVIDIDLAQENDHPADWESTRVIYKRELVRILKDSPSRERKFLRWKVVQRRTRALDDDRPYDVVEKEELEVCQETSF
ncbi:hypothetical protein BJ322DRAFT_180839 [Thelephora terrestris]|uniref:F-box domain-containing protein n=1 Tax=Thelephora terrestris TaxID=56493 RepID=A0A9P6L4Z7_9AGAM|nr:hypothetical protein BJ322DRAFT_180839 [Thelephora terrestris]